MNENTQKKVDQLTDQLLDNTLTEAEIAEIEHKLDVLRRIG